jgi:tetratricopeptide (TPR) repeat protein
MEGVVKAWGETVNIPTYKIGKPEKNPLFLEGRVYQGSSGVVYPYAVIEQVSDEKEDRAYTALFLENKYLKLMILPEIGGRVHMALDKVNGYHFIYHNRVIKPALVGLTGPWISGGLEFNWPQHHRPSTFAPVDWRIDESVDGSKTIWCSEIEIMSRMKGMHGITLHPDTAYFEVSVQLYNRTNLAQTFLWWANPAVPANENTQTVFPPDVHAVMDHGKRDVASFPIAKGVYYKVDYSPGTDISRYKNIPVPTSYMAHHSQYDFIGHYDHGKQVGMLHVADHHIVPGKKMWTWGSGSFGEAWERQLTDDDGPYVELMCGAYSDNQPDFAWLMPGEEKNFKQYFMPYRKIGPPKNANRDALINLEYENQTVRIFVFVTKSRSVTIRLQDSKEILLEKQVDITPESPFIEAVPVTSENIAGDIHLAVLEKNRELLSYTIREEEDTALPEAAKALGDPAAIETVEGLYLAGLHLEQYRHATYFPEPYYTEGVRRDPLNYHCNNALGLIQFRQGKFEAAKLTFEKAMEGITRHNKNPYDGEVFYNYGLVMKALGKPQEAFDAFYKAVWNAGWQDVGYFEMAKLACQKGELDDALEYTRRSLRRNYFHHKARHLRIAILRRMGQSNAALREASLALELDRMEFGAMWERYLLVQDPSFSQLTHQNPASLIEISLDYIAAGMYLEAMALLRRIPIPDPMAEYYLGWCHFLDGDIESASGVFLKAMTRPIDYCFPNQIDCIFAFKAALQLNPQDSRANYLLGNFFYSRRNYQAAIECWEKSAKLDPDFPTVFRNLGIAYFNVSQHPEQALEAYERAFDLDPTDGRVLYELDQLYKRLNHPPQGRLIRLENYNPLVEMRDDLTLEYISLLNLFSRYQQALSLLTERKFHPWEGGEGRVAEQYIYALIELAKIEISEKQFTQALALLERAQTYPENLGEGKLYGMVNNELNYYLGVVYKNFGVPNESRYHFRIAASGTQDLSAPIYYNDSPVTMAYYQGLAMQELGQNPEAISLFMKMIANGENHVNDNCKPDYFSVSLVDFLVFNIDLNRKNRIHCNYLIGLGYLGLKQSDKALEYFGKVLSEDSAHLGAICHSQVAKLMQQ